MKGGEEMVQSTLISTSIVIKYVAGVKPDGKDIFKNLKLNNIRVTTKDEDLFAIGLAIMSLMGQKAVDLGKTLDYSLMES